EGRGVGAEVLDRPPADGPLDPPEGPGDLVPRLPRADQNVDVLRHDDVGPHVEPLPTPGPLDRLDHPAPGPVAGQQGEPPVAGEGRLVGVAGVVVAPASLACHRVTPSPRPPGPGPAGTGSEDRTRGTQTRPFVLRL